MSTHNLCFRAKIGKMYTLVHPSFTIQKWGVRGYSLHGLVFVMCNLNYNCSDVLYPKTSFKQCLFEFPCCSKTNMAIFCHKNMLKDLYSTAPKRGSVFIGLMTPDGAIWSRYQRTVLMR